MNVRYSAIIGVLAGVIAVAACKNDPLRSENGQPVAISVSFSELDVAVGATATVTAAVLDGRSVPLDEPITFTSRDPGTATAALDGSFVPVPATTKRAIITGIVAGTTYVIVTGGGQTDSVKVVIS